MNSHSNFFERSNYYIRENAISSKKRNSYQIFNNSKENIGFVKEKTSKIGKIAGVFFRKSLFPARIEITSANGTLEVVITRKYFFQKNRIIMHDPRGNVLGFIKKKFQSFRTTYLVMNEANEVIAEISENGKEWSFLITDNSNSKIGTIHKIWKGIMKDIYSSADKYNVNIKTEFENKNDKIAIFSSAIVMYML